MKVDADTRITIELSFAEAWEVEAALLLVRKEHTSKVYSLAEEVRKALADVLVLSSIDPEVYRD